MPSVLALSVMSSGQKRT
ncbi:hypothetical protein CKAN_01882300 [Cinnamomum micranthum f. kanehirae]|uniref:Uncharacterized protein n=1 Tax=Cinnamomum micranthum f. kanehirae TaxID=337451 RepID=A0A443PG70_9MAGN|nr:hypothetical protein CKAN_01882300 [Cinnamomum micranthum f. kanehirae]